MTKSRTAAQNEKDLEDEIVAAALAGIADIEAGRFKTIASKEDAEALYDGIMDRLRARLAQEGKLPVINSQCATLKS